MVRCGGSIESISVVGDPLGEEELLQTLLVVERRLHPQVGGARQNAFCEGQDVREGSQAGTARGDSKVAVSGCGIASGKWASSLPEAHAGLLGGFSQGSIFTAQHEFSSLRQLEVGGVIDRQLVSGSQL